MKIKVLTLKFVLRYGLTVILILILLLVVAFGQNEKWGGEEWFIEKARSRTGIIPVNTVSNLPEILLSVTPVVTQAPIPTPTLTLEQIAEARRKKLAEMNAKYGPCRYVPILMYHHVLDAKKAKEIFASNLNVPPEIFREQMDYLINKGYQIIGLEEMFNDLKNNSLPGKPAVLTFDDGYRDFFDSAYAILREKNLKATVFVISQFIGGEKYMEWWQIKEMVSSGLILIGDHTLNHPSLPKLTMEEEFNQIVSAKNVIEQNTGVIVNFFAYPYGGGNQNARDILKENGFVGAVTTMVGSTQCVGLPFDMQRIRIGGGSLSRYGL